jgi:hypothetical protein
MSALVEFSVDFVFSTVEVTSVVPLAKLTFPPRLKPSKFLACANACGAKKVAATAVAIIPFLLH